MVEDAGAIERVANSTFLAGLYRLVVIPLMGVCLGAFAAFLNTLSTRVHDLELNKATITTTFEAVVLPRLNSLESETRNSAARAAVLEREMARLLAGIASLDAKMDATARNLDRLLNQRAVPVTPP
jgi:hypothetical protein